MRIQKAFKCNTCGKVHDDASAAMGCHPQEQEGLFRTGAHVVWKCPRCKRAHNEIREAWHCCKMANQWQARKNVILKRLIMRMHAAPIAQEETAYDSFAQSKRTGALRRQLFELNRKAEGLRLMMAGRAK
jgi:hypothetical protein